MDPISPATIVKAARNQGELGFAFLLFAAMAVALGNSVVLPFLPEMVDQVSPGASGLARGHLVVALVTVSQIAGCLSAPLWGWVSDGWKRWPILVIGLLGFGLTMGWYSAAGFEGLYVLRLLNGVFAATVVRTAFAIVADQSPDLVRRARQFTWLNALVFAGELTGPLLGEVSVSLGAKSPFLAPAALSAVATLCLLLVSRKHAAGPVGSVPRPKAREALVPLLLISAIASGCLTVLHLTLSLGSGPRNLSRENVSMLFGLCGGAMLVAQLVLFTVRRVAVGAAWLLRPMLAGLAAALIIAVFAWTLWVLVPVFLLAGWSTATLKLLTNYLTSKASPGTQGSGLALQYAAVSAGQAAASIATGWASASEHLMLWVAAAAALVVAATTLRMNG
jgi:MFS family permease